MPYYINQTKTDKSHVETRWVQSENNNICILYTVFGKILIKKCFN